MKSGGDREGGGDGGDGGVLELCRDFANLVEFDFDQLKGNR